MWKFLLLAGFGGALISGCSTTRKLSQVNARQLSSAPDAAVASPARARASHAAAPAGTCPKETAEYAAIAATRVAFPECPEALSKNFENSLQYLKSEERYTLEEIMKGHCRSLGLGEFGESLEELVNNFTTTGPAGRLSNLDPPAPPEAAKSLEALRLSLTEMVDLQLPLERWGRRFGSFVLPDEDLVYLNRLLLDQGCKMGEDEVDSAYHSLRALEELSHIIKAGPQREQADRFLLGVHKVIDRRLQEFFPK